MPLYLVCRSYRYYEVRHVAQRWLSGAARDGSPIFNPGVPAQSPAPAWLAFFRILDAESHARAICNAFELLENGAERSVLGLNRANCDILDSVISTDNGNLNERVAFAWLQCLTRSDEPINKWDHQPIVRIVPSVEEVTEVVSRIGETAQGAVIQS
jgi:hypothetical protein